MVTTRIRHFLVSGAPGLRTLLVALAIQLMHASLVAAVCIEPTETYRLEVVVEADACASATRVMDEERERRGVDKLPGASRSEHQPGVVLDGKVTRAWTRPEGTDQRFAPADIPAHWRKGGRFHLTSIASCADAPRRIRGTVVATCCDVLPAEELACMSTRDRPIAALEDLEAEVDPLTAKG